MSVYSKTIHILEQKNESLKKALAAEETRIGFLCLDDKSCSEEDSARYDALKADFQQLMMTLSEIKSLEAKKKDLTDDIQNVKTDLASFVTKESGLLLTLGIALYGQSGAADVPSFAKYYEEASAYAEKITSLKTQSEQMTESLELQNVFSRVVTKVKINTLSISINTQQKKLDAALVAGAKALVEAQDLDESLKCPAYETCIAFKNDWNKVRIRLEALQDELQNVDVTLTDYGRKALIQEKANGKNSEIEAFAQQIGHAFDKKYVTRDGEMLTEFPPKYKDGLSNVLELRESLASVNRRIDILKYSEQIEAAVRSGEAMKKEMAANEEKIGKLQSRNAELDQLLEKNDAAEEELTSHRSAVEKEEGVTIDDLLAMTETEVAKSGVKIAEKASELAKQAGDGLKKAASGAVKKATGKKTATKKPAPAKADASGSDSISDDEEAEFLGALNAARASAASEKQENAD